MKKTLVVLAHPNLEQSRINKAWVAEAEKYENVTIHDLYKAYPDYKIDVAHEQELAMAHDRIVFQFPFYWYSSPSLLKKWQDDVLTYGWAYGSTGDKLHGKQFVIATSTGGPAEAYEMGGYNEYSMSELLKPFRAMSNLTGMIYKPAFLVQGVNGLQDEQVAESAVAYATYITQE